MIEAVAERRGWTAGELADRTVPTGGLDENGVLLLECGPERTYTARLDEEDKHKSAFLARQSLTIH